MNTTEIKLSILIPTYNREKFIIEAIDSVLNQDFQDFEIICSDNASTDNTYKILLDYAKKDNRIKVFQSVENLGPIPNWEICLSHANGEFIHWLWSDDWIETNFYIDAFALMKKNHTRIVSTWNYRSDNLDDRNDKYISWQFSHSLVPGNVAAKKILFMTYELPVSPAAYILPIKSVRKHFYKNIVKLNDSLDPVNKAVGVDSLMIIGSCMEEEKISILQKPSVVFRKHDNISFQLSKDGSLFKMYLLSHFWFASRENIQINIFEFFSILKKVFFYFPKDIYKKKIINILIKLLLKSKITKNKEDLSNKYKSKKAFMRKNVILELDETLNNLDIENKKIYITPFNDVTSQLRIKLELLSSKKVIFIDNYKKGENIISPEFVIDYDYIFIYSPNYQIEIAKRLPKKNLYCFYQLPNTLYSVTLFSKVYIFKQKLKMFFDYKKHKKKIVNKIEKLDMFSIGSQIIYLSNQIKNYSFKDKKIYITPVNDTTVDILNELEKYHNNSIELIENEFEKIEKDSYLLIYDSEDKKQIIRNLSTKNIYLIYHIPKKGIKIIKYTFLNLFYKRFSNISLLIYLNIIYKIRLYFANTINIPIHKNEKEILKLKNIHKNQRAFIIGNGPSLKISDLDRLENEITFAANKIYLSFNETKWRPTYYSVEDNLVMKEIYKKVKSLTETKIILPIKDIKEYNYIKSALYYPLIKNRSALPGFSDNILKEVFPGNTVTYSMLQMAIYMGIKEVYFIGIDFSYELPKIKNQETNIICNDQEINHFHKDYRRPGDKWIKPNESGQIKAYESALVFCNKNNIKIYNASRKTKLQVFERIDFDKLF